MSGKLKIVFLDYVLELDKPGRSGLSDIVWDMSSELVKLGHEVHVVAPYSQELAPDQRVTVHTIKVPPTGYRWFVGHLWICKRLADIAYELNPDIIQAPEYVSIAVYNTLYPRGKPRLVLTVPGNIFHRLKTPVERSSLIVLTVPGNIFHKLRTRKGNPYAYFFTQCLKWSARKVSTTNTLIIATSQEMKEAWEETGSLPSLTPLIPLGTNPDRFYPVHGARDKLGIDKDTIFLLYVGRFSREKALRELVETISDCQQTLRESKVAIRLVGKGPQATLLAQLVKNLQVEDLVTLHDWVAQDELSTWYSAADALLFPSFAAEAFGRVMTEAMLCGTPIIGSNIAALKDHVIPNCTGLLFEAGDFGQFRVILEKIAQQPELLRAMRQMTREYAVNTLTWPAIVKKIVNEIYLSKTYNFSNETVLLKSQN